MISFFLWWLVVFVLAAAVVPVTFRLFHSLPDRGYAATKPLALLLAAYLYWIAASLGFTANDRGSAFLILLLFIIGGLFVAAAQRGVLLAFLRAEWRYIVVVEALFLIVFAWFAFLHSFTPDISSTEKPFELAFLNGVSRGQFFPPHDPWFGGLPMSYYYFGYVVVDFLDKLTRIGNGVGFNLGTPLTAALAGATIFGLVYNLARGIAGARRWAILFGLLAVVLLLVVSSLEGVFELANAHGIGSAAFYKSLGIGGLPVAKTAPNWYPNDTWSFWWWWRATRMGSNWNIMEFPFFSFLLGDLHPHVMVIPYTLLALTVVWSLFIGGETLDGWWWRRNPVFFAVVAILLGALALLNTWDQPTSFSLLFLVAFVANTRRLAAWSWRALGATLLFVASLLAVSYALFIPFWVFFQRPDFLGVSPTMVTAAPPGDIRAAMALPPVHLLLFWGPLFWISATFVVAYLFRIRALSQPVRYLLWPAGLTALLFVAWILMVIRHSGVSGLSAELSMRGSGLLTELILALLLVLGLSALMRAVLPEKGPAAEPSVSFALLAVSLGYLLILGAELFFVHEAQAPARANTVFKLWYQAWLLESLGGAAGLAYLVSGWSPSRVLRGPHRIAWGVVTSLVMLAALAYPLAGSFSRSNGFTGPQTLDGLAYWQKIDPGSFAAANWLAENVQGTPVILEAEGPPLAGTYSGEGGRISELSGIPTILGWSDHEWQERGNLQATQARSQAIRTIYTTTSIPQAENLLGQYGVRYVVVGLLERQVYGDAGMAKFAQLGDPVFSRPQITIYDLTKPVPLPGAQS